jgi:dienelactone hydrolase
LRTLVAALLTVAVLGAPLTAHAGGEPVDPSREAANFSKQGERAPDYLTPTGLRQQARQGGASFIEGVRQQAADPGRLFVTDLCWSKAQGCGGDPRLSHWRERGYGMVRPVRFTGRNGSTLAGHVWATRRGPGQRPLVVITPGSLQATEEMYWWAAQVLAKAGYVVVTRDAQNQGRSDTFGHGADTFAGVPAQATGTTFFDHTQDTLDFALSRPGHRYCPRTSRSGVSHCPKQRRRVVDGRATPYNPMWRLVDPHRVGLAGHSYGAAGSTWVGQQDRRVDAVVAWDNLCNPAKEPRSSAPGRASGAGTACPPGGLGSPQPRVPSLGISADYYATPTPYTADPAPGTKSRAAREFSAAGVDSGEIVIRGGTHYEWSYIPTPTFGATLRGIDLSAWYTTAWFDRYVKDNRLALRMLLSNRWRHDGVEASVDPVGDGNMFSYHYRSWLHVGHDAGPRIRCQNLRRGCTALVSEDGHDRSYSYLAIATSPDGRTSQSSGHGRRR